MTDLEGTTDGPTEAGERGGVPARFGANRRALMKLFGAGAAVATLGSTTAAATGQDHRNTTEKNRGKSIDKIYGAPYAAGETVPSGLVDHVVTLNIQEEDVHPGFPVDPSSGEEIPAEFFFDPVGLHVKPGEVLHFHVNQGLHTATSFDPKFGEPPEFVLPKRVPTDYGFTAPPLAADDSWLYRFTEQGVYDLLCLPHVELGMVMRIVVSPDDQVPSEDYGTLEIPNASDVLGASELCPSNIVEKGQVDWADLSL